MEISALFSGKLNFCAVTHSQQLNATMEALDQTCVFGCSVLGNSFKEILTGCGGDRPGGIWASGGWRDLWAKGRCSCQAEPPVRGSATLWWMSCVLFKSQVSDTSEINVKGRGQFLWTPGTFYLTFLITTCQGVVSTVKCTHLPRASGWVLHVCPTLVPLPRLGCAGFLATGYDTPLSATTKWFCQILSFI